MNNLKKDIEEVANILLNNKKEVAIRKVFELKSNTAFYFKKEYLSSKDKEAVYWKYAVPSFDFLKIKEARFCKRQDRKQGWWD